MAFGGYVGKDVGGAIIEVMGRRGAVTVIFGEERNVSVLGVTALETLGLEVDVVRGRLRRLSNYCFNLILIMKLLE